MFIFVAINKENFVMRLSELKTGEKGVIIKLLGHGGFRKLRGELGVI